MCPQGGFTNNQLCWFQITREVKQLFKTRIGLNFLSLIFTNAQVVFITAKIALIFTILGTLLLCSGQPFWITAFNT